MNNSLEETLRVDDESADVRTDGGDVASPFEAVSEYEETRADRFRKITDAYVRAPAAIIWRDWRARIGIAILAVYLVTGIVGPMLLEPPRIAEGPALAQPFENWEYPLGTDRQGQDLLTRSVYSTQTILKMIFAGGLFTVGMGTIVGSVAGYKGGRTDTVLSTITDVFINIPGLPLVMVLSLLLPIGQNPYIVGVILSIAAWGGLARSIRSQVLTLREESFVEAARSMGMPTRNIVSRDIVPHLVPYVVINFTTAARRVIFEAVALYFLNILPFEHPNWGVTLNTAYSYGAHYRPAALHWFLVPMAAIVGLSMGLILLGQSLDRVFNPRVRARHEKTAGDAGEATGGDVQ